MASASGLLKSAASVRNQLATYQDALAASQYKYSGFTDSALSSYSGYLQSQIDALNKSGSIANASKALSLTNALVSAQSSNISASISNETDQIMRGNATPQDKYNLIVNNIQRAGGIGDQTLVNKLTNQADSLSQTIQAQMQTAHDSAITYAKAQGASQDSVATQLQDGLRQLNADIGAGGMAKFNSVSKDWVTAHKDQLMTLADSLSTTPDMKAAIEKAVNTSQPGYQDIIAGVTNAIIAAHTTAANAVAPYDPAEAQTYMDQASAVANGQTKIDTLAGSLSASDVMNWQQQPGMFIPHENTTGGKLSFSYKSASLPSGASSVSGYQYDKNNNLVPVFTGNETGTQPTQSQVDSINQQLTKLGFSFKKLTTNDNITNGVSVTFGPKTPSWLKNTTFGQQNLTTQMYVTDKGLQFGTIDPSGDAHGFMLAKDSNGLSGLFTAKNVNGQLSFSKQNAPGEYGFNQSMNSVLGQGQQSVLGKITQQVQANGFKPPQSNGFNPMPTSRNPNFIPPTPGMGAKPTMTQRAGGGYNFTNNGQAMSAATYSKMTNTPFRDLLTTMSTNGDAGAKAALGFVGNDYGYNPTSYASYQNSGTYNALTWGAGVAQAPSTIPASVMGNGASLTY